MIAKRSETVCLATTVATRTVSLRFVIVYNANVQFHYSFTTFGGWTQQCKCVCRSSTGEEGSSFGARCCGKSSCRWRCWCACCASLRGRTATRQTFVLSTASAVRARRRWRPWRLAARCCAWILRDRHTAGTEARVHGGAWRGVLDKGRRQNATGRVADGARSAESDVLDFHIGGTMFTLAGVPLFDLWAQNMGVLCVLPNSK